MVPADGKVYVFFPLWTAELDLDANDPVIHFPTNSLTCKGLSGDVDTGTVPCSYEASVYNDANKGGQLLTVTNLLTQNTSSAFSFTIENVRNPPVPDAITGFEIRTGDSGTGFIDVSTHVIQVHVL